MNDQNSPPESLISPELIEDVKSRDRRFQVIDTAIKIDNELRDSTLIQMVVLAANREADAALEKLANADPANINEIIKLQSLIYRAKFIERTILLVREQARMAEASIKSSDELMEDSDGN